MPEKFNELANLKHLALCISVAGGTEYMLAITILISLFGSMTVPLKLFVLIVPLRRLLKFFFLKISFPQHFFFLAVLGLRFCARAFSSCGE